MQHQQLVHRPLASFSTMRFTDYRALRPQSQSTIASTIPSTPPLVTPVEEVDVATPPLVTPVFQKLKIKIKKKHPVPTPVTPVVTTSVTPVEKQKLKITIVKRKPSENPTNKIKITIKKQPQKQEKEQQPQEKEQCFIHHDIAPPSSMIYNPCGDYIAPPPKCCRFFIDNRHCFLRSTDNACIDPITKIVFGFWNCEIGAKCKLLAVDDDTVYEVCGECQETQKENEEFCKNLLEPQQNDNDDHETRAEMRKKSDANRSRLAGQPAALLRHKIAMQYGMHSFNSHGNRIRTHSN